MYLNTSKYRDRNRLDRRESYHSAMQSYTNNTPKYAASFPNVKSKDLVCTFCRKRFYYSQDLKATSKLPLLLPCGHLTCSNCEYTYASSPKLCPLCPYVKENLSRKNLSIHVHLVGLLKVISCVPPHMDDPDMTFQTPDEAMALKKMSNMDSDKDVCVNKCGSIATLKCVQCNIVLCKSCSNKIHDIALQWHTTVSLNVKAVELVPNFCTNHKTEASEYYCITCDYECCSHCIIQTHKDHETLRQTDRNEQLMPEFMEACEKLRETRIRTHRIFKRLSGNQLYAETIRQSENMENTVTQYFIYLHGVLQNIEQEVKYKLVAHRKRLQKDIEMVRKEINDQEEVLKSATSMAQAARVNHSKVNLKKLTEKLLEISDLPCHIVLTENYEQGFSFEKDEATLIECMKQNIKLDVPESSAFNLLKTDQLPLNFEIEPIPNSESLNFSFQTCSRKESPSIDSLENSQQSLPSVPSMDNSLVMEPARKENEKFINVRVSEIHSPTSFYVQKIQDFNEMLEMDEELMNFIQKDSQIPEHILDKTLYFVQHSGDLRWYRGRVQGRSLDQDTNEELYEVFFIDLGITECGVTHRVIRYIHTRFSQKPGIAMHCTLEEIAPLYGEWTPDVIFAFKEMVRSELFMRIISCKNNLYTVDLLKTTNGSNNLMSVHTYLLDCNLAKSVTLHKLMRMNPLSAQTFYYDDLPLDKYTSVTVSHIVDPNCIYVTKRNRQVVDSLNSLLNAYVDELRQKDLPIRRPEYGNAVGVFNHKTKLYDRGYIKNIYPDQQRAEVFLVDSGRCVAKSYRHLKHLAQRYCDLVAQSIKISLADIEPINGSWDQEVNEYLVRHLFNTSVKVIPFDKIGDNIYRACIYTRDETNVNANLVSKNFAISTGKHSKHTALNKEIAAKKQKKKRNKNKNVSKEIIHEVPREEEIAHEKPIVEKKNLIKDIDDPYQVRVDIEKIETPDSIYVKVHGFDDEFRLLERNLQEFYSTRRIGTYEEPQTDRYYCVYSPKDHKFCRAIFMHLSEDDPDKATMLLVDSATEADVEMESIQPLDPRFKRVNMKIFKIKLVGISPCGGSKNWQSTSCQKLKEIIKGQGESKYYITLMGTHTSKVFEPMPVKLIIRRNIVTGPTQPNKKETLSVAKCMVEEGVALPIRGFIESEGTELAVELQKKLRLDSSFADQSENLLPPVEKIKDSTEVNNVDEVLNRDEESSPEVASDSIAIEMSKDEDNDTQNITCTTSDVSSESSPMPPKLCDWIPAIDIYDTTFIANITYVDYYCNVYFHPNETTYTDTLEMISNSLFNHFNNRSIKKYDHIWEIGDLCIAKYHNDNKWYRGKVQSVNNGLLKVLFVDFGNVEDCPTGFVKKRIILENIPIQCTRAQISGLKPIGNSWAEKELDEIHSIIVGKSLKIKVVQKPPTAPWMVAMWIIENNAEYSLPWFIKYKTDIKCIAEENEHYKINQALSTLDETDEDFIEYTPTNLLNNDSFSFETPNVDAQSTSSTDDDDDVELEDTSEIDTNCDTVVETNILQNDTETIRDEYMYRSNYYSSAMSAMNHNLSSGMLQTSSSTTKSESKSTGLQSLKLSTASSDSSQHLELNYPDCKKRIVNREVNKYFKDGYNSLESSDDNDRDEKMISGYSPNLCLNQSFDAQSVRTDDLNAINIPSTSTPLNISSEDDSENDEYMSTYRQLDLKAYNVKTLKISIGQMFTLTQGSAEIVLTSNAEINDYIKLVKEVEGEMQRYAQIQPRTEPIHGKLCIAKFAHDQRWYRAIVMSVDIVDEEVEVSVRFIDYGNVSKINDLNSIREIHRRWSAAPALGFNFKFANIRASKDLYREAQKALSDALRGVESFYAIVKKHNDPVEIELYLDENYQDLAYESVIDSGLLEMINPYCHRL